VLLIGTRNCVLDTLNSTSISVNCNGPVGAGAGASPGAGSGTAPDPPRVGIKTTPSGLYPVVLKPKVILNLAP
jgi:hypothetical protein